MGGTMIAGFVLAASLGVLPLGSVSDVASVPLSDCIGHLTTPGVVCKKIKVRNCQGNANIFAFVEIANRTAGTHAGAVFLHAGGGGSALYKNETLTEFYRSVGFKTVRIAWPSHGWQDGLITGRGIKYSACRVATVAKWVADTYGTTGATCFEGSSGGSGAGAMMLAYYGVDQFLNYVLLDNGPPFAKTNLGCDPASTAALQTPNPCPDNWAGQYGHPYSFLHEDGGTSGHSASIDQWAETTSCAKNPTDDDKAKWESINSVIPDPLSTWQSSYSIPVDMYLCANGYQNGSHSGGHWFATSTTGVQTKCYGGISDAGSLCNSEVVYNDPVIAEEIRNNMVTKCVKPDAGT